MDIINEIVADVSNLLFCQIYIETSTSVFVDIVKHNVNTPPQLYINSDCQQLRDVKNYSYEFVYAHDKYINGNAGKITYKIPNRVNMFHALPSTEPYRIFVTTRDCFERDFLRHIPEIEQMPNLTDEERAFVLVLKTIAKINQLILTTNPAHPPPVA
jgi:hypothetical protein